MASKADLLFICSFKRFDLDKAVSLIVLARAMARHTAKSIDIFVNDPENHKLVHNIIAPTGVNFVEKLSSDSYVITMPKSSGKVSEVKWEETETEIKLYLFTESGSLKPSPIAIQDNAPKYEQTILFGINKKRYLEELLSRFKLKLTQDRLIALDIKKDNEQFADENIVKTDLNTYSELVHAYASDNGWTLTSEEATALLAGIYWKTAGLRNRNTNEKTFAAVAKLFAAGGNIQTVDRLIYRKRETAELEFGREVIANMKRQNNNIVTSQVSAEVAKQVKFEKLINPTLNPLAELGDIDANFVFVPTSPKTTLVLCSPGKYRQTLTNSYKLSGDDYNCELKIDKPIADATVELLDKLDNQRPATKPANTLNKSAPRPTPVARDPLSPATETVKPDPAPRVEMPKALFNPGGGGGNPFGPF